MLKGQRFESLSRLNLYKAFLFCLTLISRLFHETGAIFVQSSAEQSDNLCKVKREPGFGTGFLNVNVIASENSEHSHVTIILKEKR